MQNNIPVRVPFSSRGDQALSLAGLTAASFLEVEALDAFDMFLVTELEVESSNDDACVVSQQKCLVEL